MTATTQQDYQHHGDDAAGAPPHNSEAERLVLGALLLDAEAIQRVADTLATDDFYHHEHALIYGAMLALALRHEPCDLLTLCHELEHNVPNDGLRRIGGVVTLTNLLANATSTVHLEHHAKLIARSGLLRRIATAGKRITDIGNNPSLEAEQALNAAQQTIHDITRRDGRKDFVRVGDVLSDFMDKLDALQGGDNATVGVPTGFTDLDVLTGGLQPSDLIVLAARPATGKTSAALCMAYSAAKKGKAVAIFNMEMPAAQLVQRLLAMETGIDSHRLRMGNVHDDEWGKIANAFAQMAELNIYIDDTSSISLMDVRAKTRRLQEEHGLDFVQIDYLQLMRSGRKDGNRLQEVSEISRGLKGLARELNVPVLAMAQLSRSVESRNSHIPMLSDLRESGTIEQDADIVAFIYREEMYDPDTDKKGLAEIHIAKHRNGPLGIVNLRFFDKTTRFTNLEMYHDESGGY